MNRVLVIGLDGGELRILEHLAAQGHMPFFASILEQGTSGKLRSAFPPVTAPAWSTCITGKGPGKHGVFDFFATKDSATALRLVDSTSLEAETLWSMLSRAGKRLGVVNVPMTYPPEAINGFLVSGMLTPSNADVFSYQR